MTSSEPIHRGVTVRSAPQHAFELFTEHMGTWWPVESYSPAYNELCGEVECVRLEFQSRRGGSTAFNVGLAGPARCPTSVLQGGREGPNMVNTPRSTASTSTTRPTGRGDR